MSLKRLQNQILSLPPGQTLQAKDVEDLREAAGNKVSGKERSAMDTFVTANQHRFSSEAILTLKDTFRIALPQSSRLEYLGQSTLGVKEASGVAALDSERFLVIDDEKGLFLHQLNGKTYPLLKSKDHKKIKGLEGVTLSEDKKTAYIVSEDTRRIYSTALKEEDGKFKAGHLEELGRLPRLGKVDNKSWEGIAIMPGRFTEDGEDKIIAVHEGRPRRVAIFSLPDLEEEKIMSLPKVLENRLRDLSDLAVHPETGHIFLLSDESSRVAELEIVTSLTAGPGALLENQSLRTLNTFDLPRDQKAEGLCFQDGNLWVSSELDQSLMQFALESN